MGAKQILFEGVPTYPDAGRCWEVCDKYGVSRCCCLFMPVLCQALLPLPALEKGR